MKTPIRTTLMLISLLAVGLLAACGANPTPSVPDATQPPAPTTDLNALRTEVAATVLAQVPQICAMTPSATLQPSATRLAETPTETPIPGTATIDPNAPTSEVLDRARWVSQSIADGTQFTPGTEFTMTWRIQNAGNSTWTAGYRLRFFAGEAFGTPKEIELGQEVKPGETVDITLNMKAPARPGEYRGDWVMSNEQRANFNEPLYLKIIVPSPTATPTRTPIPTNTPTSTPEPTLTPTAS